MGRRLAFIGIGPAQQDIFTAPVQTARIREAWEKVMMLVRHMVLIYLEKKLAGLESSVRMNNSTVDIGKSKMTVS